MQSQSLTTSTYRPFDFISFTLLRLPLSHSLLLPSHLFPLQLQQTQHAHRASRSRILPPHSRRDHCGRARCSCHCDRLRPQRDPIVCTATSGRLHRGDRPPVVRSSTSSRLDARDRPPVIRSTSTSCLHARHSAAIVCATAAGSFDGCLDCELAWSDGVWSKKKTHHCAPIVLSSTTLCLLRGGRVRSGCSGKDGDSNRRVAGGGRAADFKDIGGDE
jgi:hypothetical protein